MRGKLTFLADARRKKGIPERSHATRRGGFDIANARRDSEKDFRLAHRLPGRIRNKRMELRHDACRNESRDRHYRRWKRVSVEMSDNARGGYDAVKKFAEANVKCLDATPFLPCLKRR